MSGFTFTLNEAGVKAVAAGEGVKALINERAAAALENARASAPVETGAYRDSLGITEAVEDADGNVTATLYSSSWYWHLVEFGSVNNGAYHVLELAANDAGLEWHPQ